MAFCALCWAKQEPNNREKKMFSLFSVVTFKNEACTSTSSISSASTDYRNGTCVTSSECVNRKGGHSKGNCAAGFGVCCVQILNDDDDTDVNYNDTYIQNPDYPSAYGDSDSITYKVSKVSNDVCTLRLDFEMLNIQGVSTFVAGQNGAAPTGGVCQDRLEITSSDSSLNPPIVCGDLNGQHMYVGMGPDSGDTVDIKFDFNGENTGRKWEIKVAQIPCNSDYTPPDGCLQWFTEPTGQIRSFNNAQTKQMLPNQEYQICIRQDDTSCCIEYQACEPNGFMLRTQSAATAMAGAGNPCTTEGYINIEGAGGNCGAIVGTNKFCEDILSFQDGAATPSVPIIDCTAPFQIGVYTPEGDDSTAGVAKVTDTGFCLDYRQLTCGTC